MKNDWVGKQWNGAPLGDKRLEKRAIKIGEACLNTPGGTLPEKFGSWSGTKGAYRFFDSPEVTHEALQKVHNKNVIEIAGASSRMVLFIQDGSELIYNKHPCTHGLGPTADAFGQGIMFHTCLAVEWSKDSPLVTIGVAKQTAWIRPKPSEETKNNDQKEKESLVWLSTLKAIGRPPIDSRWVSVGDRGNDIVQRQWPWHPRRQTDGTLDHHSATQPMAPRSPVDDNQLGTLDHLPTTPRMAPRPSKSPYVCKPSV